MPPLFPAFQSLSMEDRDSYNNLIKSYPPVSDICFNTLKIWWDINNELRISSINGNLLISYKQRFDSANSGICIVGHNNIDKSIEHVFKHLKNGKRKAELIHVPEFVISKIKHMERFSLVEELDYNEYILDSQSMSKLTGHDYKHIRNQINRFNKYVEDKTLIIRVLELSEEETQKEIFDSLKKWEIKYPPKNDPDKTEHLALRRSMGNSSFLGLRNIAVYIDTELCGFLIYSRPLEGDYFISHHNRVNYEIPYLTDFLHYQLALVAMDEGVQNINVEMDLGLANLREHKMKLRPKEFFRKYRIRPNT